MIATGDMPLKPLLSAANLFPPLAGGQGKPVGPPCPKAEGRVIRASVA